jgi:ferredoxin
MFRVTVDTDACAGIFACLVRDDRLVEGADGLVTFDPAAAERVERGDGYVRATFAEGRERAEQAAAACPPSAITVEPVADTPAEVDGCR